MIAIYTDYELRELSRAISDYTAEDLLWQILYIEAVAHQAPNLPTIRQKLLSLPKDFELIMLNTVDDSAAVQDLTQAVYEGNLLFVQYVDAIFGDGNNKNSLRERLDNNVHVIVHALRRINPAWGTDEWMTMITHETKLINTVMNDSKNGKHENLAEILPLIRKLKMDMADYLTKGLGSYKRQAASESPVE